ncbi:MAG TPA: hypothetical protein VGI28_04380 [Stellaceae bacterium]
MLARTTFGVAEHSQHITGRALDIRHLGGFAHPAGLTVRIRLPPAASLVRTTIFPPMATVATSAHVLGNSQEHTRRIDHAREGAATFPLAALNARSEFVTSVLASATARASNFASSAHSSLAP